MQIVTWNSRGGFRRKAEVIEALQPDLAIIQECECPDWLRAQAAAWQARDTTASAHDLVVVPCSPPVG